MRGADKLMMEVEGQPLIRCMAERARGATKGPVIVALPLAPHPRYEALHGLDVTLLPVPDATEGMGASIRTAVAALPSGSKAAMLLLGDLPEVTEKDIKNILEAIDLKSDTAIWRGATEDGKPGHPIVFAASLFPALIRLSGDSGGSEVVAQANHKTRLIPLPGQRARLDLDTPEDWDAWRKARAQ